MIYTKYQPTLSLVEKRNATDQFVRCVKQDYSLLEKKPVVNVQGCAHRVRFEGIKHGS